VLWCFVSCCCVLTLFKCCLIVSAASDVDPDHVAGQRVAEPAATARDAALQTTEQPAATTVAESAEELPALARTAASTPTRDEEATRTPPPSSVVEEEDRVPTPPPAEERGVPTPPRAGASSSAGSPGLDQGLVMPATTAGGSAANKETQAASDDDVEEIEGRPRDGRQHVYVWRQRGDHFIGHEELAEMEEVARVERTAKRLVDEVKVSGPLCYSTLLCCFAGSTCALLAGRNENGEVPEEVLRPNRGHCGREQGPIRGGGPTVVGGWGKGGRDERSGRASSRAHSAFSRPVSAADRSVTYSEQLYVAAWLILVTRGLFM